MRLDVDQNAAALRVDRKHAAIPAVELGLSLQTVDAHAAAGGRDRGEGGNGSGAGGGSCTMATRVVIASDRKARENCCRKL